MPFVWLVLIGLVVLALVLMFTGTKPKTDAQLLASLRMPRISPELLKQLLMIEPSIDKTMSSKTPCLYYPCMVRLKEGELVDKVILTKEFPWIKMWGVYPSADRGKHEILISEVVEILPTESRLPASFATQRYTKGENSMGGTFFTMVFDDGTRLGTYGGNVIDIVDYPPGKGPENVVEVLPYVNRQDPNYVTRPKFYWCLFNA